MLPLDDEADTIRQIDRCRPPGLGIRKGVEVRLANIFKEDPELLAALDPQLRAQVRRALVPEEATGRTGRAGTAGEIEPGFLRAGLGRDEGEQ